MKPHQVVLLILLSVLTFSCVDDLTDIGSNTRPTSDGITMGTDTFSLVTENVFVDTIYFRPDSFLLGTYYDKKFGTTQADILAQVMGPIGYTYPVNSVADSAKIILYYKTCFGDSLAPLDLNIYELSKKTFKYDELYPSNLDYFEYTDYSIKLGERIVRAGVNGGIKKYVEFKLSKKDFVPRFFNDAHYGSESDFLDFFKGIYIKAQYGASTILNVDQIDLELYTHHVVQQSGTNILDTIKSIRVFPANAEVRKVNRFMHPDRTAMVKQKDSVNYIVSPANLQTRIYLPLKSIKQKIDLKMEGKKKIINKAILKINATDIDDATFAMPLVGYVLLIKEDSVKNFFENKKLPSDTYAILAQITASQIGTTGKYKYYYSYDIAKLIANELKNNASPDKPLNMVLVPVSVESTTSSSTSTTTVTAVKHQYLMSAVTIRSGKEVINPLTNKSTSEPMMLKLIYSGF